MDERVYLPIVEDDSEETNSELSYALVELELNL